MGEMKLSHPTLAVFCGWPLSGKSTTAKLVADALNKGRRPDAVQSAIHVADIDPIRHATIGLPYPHPNESPELAKKDGVEMGGAYTFLMRTIEWHLKEMRSLIVTATFSRRSGQRDLLRVYSAHFDERVGTNAMPCALRIIQCIPTDDSEELVNGIFKRHVFGDGGYVGGVNSPERYFEVKNRYEPIFLPHLKLETWPDQAPDTCATNALEYVIS